MAVLKVKASPIFQVNTAKMPATMTRATIVSLVTALTIFLCPMPSLLASSPLTPKDMRSPLY
jgi:hypothetical protein